MAVNNFLPFGTASGANVIDQVSYSGLAARSAGFSSGTAQSAQLNKVWRQSSIMAAVLAQLIVDRTGNDAIDDGTTAALLASLKESTAALNGDSGQVFNAANPVSGTAGNSQVLNRQYADGRYLQGTVVTPTSDPTYADSSNNPPSTSWVRGATTGASKIQSVSASVASNAMTIGYAGGMLDFRSATLAIGAPISSVSVPANSIVIPSGATLGTVSGQQSQIVMVEYCNEGNPVAGVINLAGGAQLDETNLVSPTTISSGATSANTFYSAASVTGPTSYRVVGVVTSTQATAGTWATAPTQVQGVGGQAFSAMGSVGFGQTPQDVTASRSGGINYYNTTGKPIFVMLTATLNGSSSTVTLTLGSVNTVAAGNSTGLAIISPVFFMVPPGMRYSLAFSGASIGQWIELR